MKEYPKIETLLNRDEKFKVIPDDWRLPEFAYLQNNKWLFTEKIDGTNIRVKWELDSQGSPTNMMITFGGKTDNAQIPAFLVTRLKEIFMYEKLKNAFSDTEVCLYGEGYGARIQKGGGKYIPNGVDFILFDVKIGDWWLKFEDVEGIAQKFGIKSVPIVGEGTLLNAIEMIQRSITSTFGNFPAEGLVVRPTIDLFSRNGHRILGKIKAKDFAL